MEKQSKTLSMKSVVSMLIVFFILSACNDDISEDVQPSLKIPVNPTSGPVTLRDQLASQVAQNLAANLSSVEIKNFLKERVTQQFDGDYNFLIANTKNENLSMHSNGRAQSVTFGDILAGNTSDASARNGSNTDILNSLGEVYPLMQIAIPALEIGDADSWDTDLVTPLVAFIPSDYDESDQGAIVPAYDHEGNYVELSADVEPNQLVIVVSWNERMFALKKSSSPTNGRFEGDLIDDCIYGIESYFENETHAYYFRSDVYRIMNDCDGGGSGGGSGGGGTGGGGGTTTCDRERKSDQKDHLLKAKFKDKGALRQVEKWLSGRPEVTLYISRGVFNSNGSHTFQTLQYIIGKEGWFNRTGLFRKLNITWKGINADLFKWDPSRFGDEMTYSWVEEDDPIFAGGATWNANLNLTFLNTSLGDVNFSGSASFSIGAQDDHIDQSFVEYCDNTDGNGTLYRGTGMEFYLKQ